MLRNEKNVIEGFNVNEHVSVFPGTATQYLDWKAAQLWFYKVYPEGAIISSEPQCDPFRTADTFVCTTKVYLTKEDREKDLPAVVRSARRGPKNEQQDTEETIDPYTLCIIASISGALAALGFCPNILSNQEKEDFQREQLGMPPATEAEAPTPANPSTPVQNTEPAPVETAAPAPTPTRRGRPPKADTVSKNTSLQVSAVEEKQAPNPVPQKTAVADTEKTTAETPNPSQETAPTMTVEEARAVICSYRNVKGTAIGNIWDGYHTDKLYHSVADWYIQGDSASRKYPEEAAAFKLLDSINPNYRKNG